MPKVSGVVEEVSEEDEQLRKEFEEFGETIKDRITDKNRPLLVKKLNHLRARRRMSEKLSQSVVQESSKERAASRRGRGKKGRSTKNEPFHMAVLTDELDTGDGDQLNETFSVPDMGADDVSPAKRKKNIPTSGCSTIVASEGPYAVARKMAAAKSQNYVPEEPSENGSTSILQDGVHVKSDSSRNLHSTNDDKPRRGRTRTVGDFRGKTNIVKVSVESESTDSSSIQQASLSMKRKARASAVPSAAKLPHDSTVEESVGEGSSSLNVSARNVKLAMPSVEGRDRSTNRGRQHKVGEPSKISEDGGKQSLASRIPKLARFPSPAVSQERGRSVSDVTVPAAAAVVNNIPQVTAHVTDTVTGRPAAGVALKLFTENQSGIWSHVADSVTDGDGTATELFTSKHRSAGTYRLHFETGAYFHKRGMETLYPHIDVVFTVVDPAKPVQLVLAVGPYGYGTLARIDGDH